MKSNYCSTGAVSRRLTVMENFVSQPRKQRLFYSLEILVSFRMEARLGGGWMSQDRWKIVEECGVRRVLQVKERRGEGQVCPGGRYVLSGRGCRHLSASCVGAFRPWEVISEYENSYFHRSRATCGIIQFFNSFFFFLTISWIFKDLDLIYLFLAISKIEQPFIALFIFWKWYFHNFLALLYFIDSWFLTVWCVFCG